MVAILTSWEHSNLVGYGQQVSYQIPFTCQDHTIET